ncbi:asparaginase [Rickenella mellea]|uniref:Asparaginase n=1 Tax=Rickenella mellea TaxID=50990 RepID=A0A4Y7QAC1_9AGAM|nr:asparaginase [Rickenella mellea]
MAETASTIGEKPLLSTSTTGTKPHNKVSRHVLVIHGGAGTMTKEGSTPAQRAEYHSALKRALRAGYTVLSEGGEAMDAAVAAVTVLEDCPLFNCAKGAVFNVAGRNELEASIMLSKPPTTHPEIPASRRGLGLTLLTRMRNPSQAARALYLSPTEAPHTMLSGPVAENLAADTGEQLVDPSYFFTESRWLEHRRGLGLPAEPYPPGQKPSDDGPSVLLDLTPTGTVGAVALDKNGCIASVTSTGGRTNKLVGRIGDTPQMSAGFWAEEWPVEGWWTRTFRKLTRRSSRRAVGVSGTGDGDYFIRCDTAATLAHRMKFLNESVEKASKSVVEELKLNGGLGGVIALDEQGNFSLTMNSSGMYRGVIREDGVPQTAIFHDDILE